MPEKGASIGDIFRIRVDDHGYVYGRITFDFRGLVDRELIAQSSPLADFPESILVEIFDVEPGAVLGHDPKVLLPGIITDLDSIREGGWEVVGSREVRPDEVEFPEAVTIDFERTVFVRGEVVLPLSFDDEWAEDLGIHPTLHGSQNIKDIALNYLGLRDSIDPEHRDFMNLERSDLRFSDHRDEIYADLEEDPSQSYSEMSDRMGYDTSRFFG